MVATRRYRITAATSDSDSSPAATVTASATAGCRDAVDSASTVRLPGSGPPSRCPVASPIAAIAPDDRHRAIAEKRLDRRPREVKQRQATHDQQNGAARRDRPGDALGQ